MIVNLTELSRHPGMPGVEALRRMIVRCIDFPIVQRGSGGLPYRFDLDAAVAFVRLVQANPRATARERREQAAERTNATDNTKLKDA